MVMCSMFSDWLTPQRYGDEFDKSKFIFLTFRLEIDGGLVCEVVDGRLLVRFPECNRIT